MVLAIEHRNGKRVARRADRVVSKYNWTFVQQPFWGELSGGCIKVAVVVYRFQKEWAVQETYLPDMKSLCTSYAWNNEQKVLQYSLSNVRRLRREKIQTDKKRGARGSLTFYLFHCFPQVPFLSFDLSPPLESLCGEESLQGYYISLTTSSIKHLYLSWYSLFSQFWTLTSVVFSFSCTFTSNNSNKFFPVQYLHFIQFSTMCKINWKRLGKYSFWQFYGLKRYSWLVANLSGAIKLICIQFSCELCEMPPSILPTWF